MRTAYLECFAGISGDMLLGAMVDAGVPLTHLEEAAAQLHVGVHLEARKVMRGGLSGTKVDVLTADGAPADHVHPEHDRSHEHKHGADEPHSHALHEHAHDHEHPHDHDHAHEHDHDHAHEHTHAPHRSLSTILKIIDEAALTGRVKQRATRAFRLLGEAEAAIHAVPVETVHFHEVGALDTIADIVCTAAGAEFLGIDRWLASPLNVGSGTVKCQHGTLPVPAPATLRLLADAPIYAAGPAMERVTPTGAVLLRMLDVEFQPLPALRITATGYGAGGRDTPGEANLLRLLVGEEADAQQSEQIAVLETVIDDSTPQLLAYVSELLLAAGAWDVYRTPVQMKKGRVGIALTVLCRPDMAPALREIIFRETTSIGLRWRMENKAALAREFVAVQTPWGPVSIKVARFASGLVANASPEYEDCRKLATAHAVPLKRIMEEAMRAFAVRTAAEKENL